MGIQLGQIAPDFEQQSTRGSISFHKWLGDSWGLFFSHPKNFTPVCTTELGEVARLKPEFDKRNVKPIGLSVDAIDAHNRWADDIKETQGQLLNFPMLADADLPGKRTGLNSDRTEQGARTMDEEDRKRPTTHELGMNLDTLSVIELEERIGLLEAEIARPRAAIAAKGDSRKAAEAAFKF